MSHMIRHGSHFNPVPVSIPIGKIIEIEGDQSPGFLVGDLIISPYCYLNVLRTLMDIQFLHNSIFFFGYVTFQLFVGLGL